MTKPTDIKAAQVHNTLKALKGKVLSDKALDTNELELWNAFKRWACQIEIIDLQQDLFDRVS